MTDKANTDAAQALERIRAASYPDAVSAELLKAVYDIEHDQQFEDERGPVRATLRNLIAETIEESS